MKKNKFLILPLILFSFVAFAQQGELNQSGVAVDKIDSSRFYNAAVVQVLNKTTAKSSMFGFDTDDSAFGVAPASVLIHFHF